MRILKVLVCIALLLPATIYCSFLAEEAAAIDAIISNNLIPAFVIGTLTLSLAICTLFQIKWQRNLYEKAVLLTKANQFHHNHQIDEELPNRLSSANRLTSKEQTSHDSAAAYMSHSANLLYDLSYLYEMEDQSYLAEVLNVYLETTPDLLSALNSHAINEQWQEAGSIAHKLKSSMGILQIKGSLVMLTDIEQRTKEGKNLEEIPALITKVAELFALTKPMIEKELLRIKELIA